MKQKKISTALGDIRIIDFGQGAIDPICTSYLADFGAEVIKIESYNQPDFVRQNIYYNEDKPSLENIQFSRYNQNKMGILLNLKHPKGIEIAKKLVALGDIAIENFSYGVMKRLGLGYEELCKVKPDIIMLSASFGGQTGPYRDLRGQGFTIAALQGIDDLTGWPDRGPVSPAAAFGDHYLPWMYANVLLAALEYRRRTGNGQFIDGSSFEGCLDMLHTAVADYSVNHRVLRRQGNRHPSAAPHGVFRCRGGERWIAIAVFSDTDWANLCKALKKPEWGKDERFSTVTGRVQNADELERLVEKKTSGENAEELALRLQKAGVTADVLKTVKDLNEDEQFAHRGHWWYVDNPEYKLHTFEAPSARLSKTPARFTRPGPKMGENNEYVYRELLGYSAEEYKQLLEDKVIY
jgi:benzylsuccinate CoA-transferase BbsF subunit